LSGATLRSSWRSPTASVSWARSTRCWRCAPRPVSCLGRVALDGTKLKADASRHKATSYDHIVPKIEQLKAEVKELLAEAEAADAAEDAELGEDRRGDELPSELARRESRLRKLAEAKESIKSEAREKAAAVARTKAEAAGKSTAEGRAARSRCSGGRQAQAVL
jgi:hypothetical protein